MLKLACKKMFTQQQLFGTGFSSTILVNMVNMLNLAHKKCSLSNSLLELVYQVFGKHCKKVNNVV